MELPLNPISNYENLNEKNFTVGAQNQE